MITLADNRTYVYQWDTGVELKVADGCSQVHFANKIYDRSIDVKVENGKATIPDVLLQSNRDIWAWGFVGGAEKGYTKFEKKIEVKRRNKPADYVFTPPEQTTLEYIKEIVADLQKNVTAERIEELTVKAFNDYLDNNPVKQVQTDYSENDENSEAYIKNRTHWTDDDGTVHKLNNNYLDMDWFPKYKIKVLAGEVVANNGMYGYTEMFYNTDRMEEYSEIFSQCLKRPFIVYIDGKRYDTPPMTYSMDGNYYMYNDGTTKFGVMLTSYAASVLVYNASMVGKHVELYMVKPEAMPEEFMPESVGDLVMRSSTKDSTKMFKITVNDNGEIIANIVE